MQHEILREGGGLTVFPRCTVDALGWHVAVFPPTCCACETVTNCVQVLGFPACLAHTFDMNSSSLARSESDRLPCPHEGD